MSLTATMKEHTAKGYSHIQPLEPWVPPPETKLIPEGEYYM